MNKYWWWENRQFLLIFSPVTVHIKLPFFFWKNNKNHPFLLSSMCVWTIVTLSILEALVQPRNEKKQLKIFKLFIQKQIFSLWSFLTEIHYFKQKKKDFFKGIKRVGNRQNSKRKKRLWSKKEKSFFHAKTNLAKSSE